MIPQLDLQADIVPGESLGGFEVSRPISDYEDLFRADTEGVVPKVWGFWQVVYRLTQIYVPTDEEYHSSFDAMEEFSRRKLAGLEADLPTVFERPESAASIEVWVDVRDGIIDAVAALPGYEGSLGGLRVGMTLAEVRAREPRIEMLSFADEVRVVGVEGVRLWFDPAEPDTDAELDEALLERIMVFDPSRSDFGVKSY